MHQTITPTPVQREVRVSLSPEAAYDLFVNRFDAWWPRDKSANPKSKLAEAVLEAKVGGRWYERGEDGSICEWGRVLACEPGKRLLLNWQLGSSYAYEPDLVTEVEVLFLAEGRGTRVTLEHRNIERFGDKWPEMRGGIAGENGWPAIIRTFADVADGRIAER